MMAQSPNTRQLHCLFCHSTHAAVPYGDDLEIQHCIVGLYRIDSAFLDLRAEDPKLTRRFLTERRRDLVARIRSLERTATPFTVHGSDLLDFKLARDAREAGSIGS